MGDLAVLVDERALARTVYERVNSGETPAANKGRVNDCFCSYSLLFCFRFCIFCFLFFCFNFLFFFLPLLFLLKVWPRATVVFHLGSAFPEEAGKAFWGVSVR